MKNSDLENVLRQLSEQRRIAAQLRGDYVRVMRSRFHALRVLWLSLKSALGLMHRDDRYFAWSENVTPFPSANDRAGGPATAVTERRLMEAWRTRMEQVH